MRTQVCITVDTEFSIGGAFTYPNRYVPLGEEVVRCSVEGREEGLGFMLQRLEEFDTKATFFVEALQTVYFGDVPMGRLTQRIAKAGHDLQLHLHPCWLHFRKRKWKSGTERPNDSCIGRSDAELDDMMGVGFYAFDRWGLPKPIALRTGGFQTDRSVYRAMERAGLRLGSNIALGMCEPSELELRITGGRRYFGNVLELPVLSYQSPVALGRKPRQWRSLSITGASWPEMKALLQHARAASISPIVIVTHAFEFVKRRDFRFDELRANDLNQNRFASLLQFLSENPDEYEAVTFQGGAKNWLEADEVDMPTLKTPMVLAVRRAAQNAINDRIWRW